MKILHITPSTDGYEEVELLANRISPKNSLALIKKDEQEFMTGGILLNDTPEVREILDNTPKDKQYNLASMFKHDPFVKLYLYSE